MTLFIFMSIAVVLLMYAVVAKIQTARTLAAGLVPVAVVRPQSSKRAGN